MPRRPVVCAAANLCKIPRLQIVQAVVYYTLFGGLFPGFPNRHSGYLGLHTR
jgi:hypothetical protein